MIRTLYGKLVAVLLGFTLIMAALFLFAIRYSDQARNQEINQSLYRSLAQRVLAPELPARDGVVDAVTVARMKAGALGADALKGSVAASDAFFPFRDGLDAIAAAGATAVVQPGGSVRDQEVIAAADEHGMAMVFAGKRHFRH